MSGKWGPSWGAEGGDLLALASLLCCARGKMAILVVPRVFGNVPALASERAPDNLETAGLACPEQRLYIHDMTGSQGRPSQVNLQGKRQAW